MGNHKHRCLPYMGIARMALSGKSHEEIQRRIKQRTQKCYEFGSMNFRATFARIVDGDKPNKKSVEYLRIYNDSSVNLRSLIDKLIALPRADSFYPMEGGDEIIITDIEDKVIDKITLCFSCDHNRMKYVTGLCEDCHKFVEKENES